MDPNDSDGSWEFVAKDTDSETSSVASPYDTGLPDSQIQDDAWSNQDDFITDSDIEACAEDSTVGSDEEEGDVKINQSIEKNDGQDANEELCNGEIHDSSTSTLTRSMINEEYEDQLPPLIEKEEHETYTEDNKPGVSSSLAYSSEDDHIEEVTSQEIINASSNDDIMQLPGIDSGVAMDTENHSSPPSILSNVSSESYFERINSSNDLLLSDPTFDPEVKNDDDVNETVPKEIADDFTSLFSAEDSDEGSNDFTVISAPTSPPVETVCHETSTATDDVVMATELDNCETIVTETASSNMRTVGMVTDHVAQPNPRLMISILMISFGVGFLVGRCPIPDSSTVYELQDQDNVKETLDHEWPSQALEYSLHNSSTYSEPQAHLSELGRSKQQVVTDHRMFYLKGQNLRINSVNRGLRSTIHKLKAKNNHLMLEQSKRRKIDENHSYSLSMLRLSHQKLQRISEIESQSKSDKIKQLKYRISTLQQDASFLNTSMTLYRRLQDQHSSLMRLYQESINQHDLEKSKLIERQTSMKLRLQRYRSESKKLIQEITKAKTYNSYMKTLLYQLETRQFEKRRMSVQDSNVKSPLLVALSENQAKTCSSGSKYRSQVKQLKIRVRGQRLLIRKYEQEMNLKSMALEMLYNSRRELSNYATCLKRRSQRKDTEGFCRSASKPSSLKPKPKSHLPQCFYEVSGTLAFDFTSMNISVNNFTYELNLSTDRTLPALYYDAAQFLPICERHHEDNLNMTYEPKASNYVPAVLYAHALMNSVRYRGELKSQKTKYLNLHQICAVRNQSLDVSRRETENAENRLVVATQELKRLRRDKKHLDQKLKNVTSELEKKPTMKQCLSSVLNTQDFLKQVDDTKEFLSSSKIAKKMKKVSDKAWKKVSKFMSKFGLNHDDHENSKTWQQRRCKKRKQHHEYENNHKNKFHHDHESSITWQNHKHEKHHNDHHDEYSMSKTWHHKEKRSNNRRPHHEYETKFHHERRHSYKKHHENSKPHEISKKYEPFRDVFVGPMTEKELCQKVGCSETKSRDESRYGGEERREHKRIHEFGGYSRKFTQNQENQPKKQYHHKNGKRNDRFRNVIRKHVEIAKVAGQKVVTGLMPIYHKWQDMYCDIEKIFLPKSFSEIWESLNKDESAEKQDSFVITDWGWDLYQNITDIISPIIPEKIAIPTWGFEWNKESSLTPNIHGSEYKECLKKTEKSEVDLGLCKTDDAGRNSIKDPQWFTHMFQARGDLRKDWGDSPLSEEEFDWFLKMFEAREELRRVGDGYPCDRGNNIELDWFLKMFEARARLRFENKQDEENWYLKLSEARNKARSDSKAQYPNIESKKDWYRNMFKARETLREDGLDVEARGRWSTKKNEDWFIKRMNRRQNSREKEKRERRRVVHGMNKRR